MKPALIVFRLVAVAALSLGLANLLFDFSPRWAVDTHVLLGILAAISGSAVLWPQRGMPLGGIGMSLAVALLMLGLGLRFRMLEGTTIGLVHLAVAVAMVAIVEMSAGRQRRAIAMARPE